MSLRGETLTVAFVLFATFPLGAQVTFDAFSEGLYASVEENGFEVSQNPAFFVLEGSSSCFPPCPENGTPYLATQSGLEPVRVAGLSGLPFALLSFDLAEQNVGIASCPEVRVTSYLDDEPVASVTFLLDGVNDGAGPLDDFQHVVLPPEFHFVTSVEFVCTSLRRYTLDNLAVSGEVIVIPTLSRLGLFGLALLLVVAGLLSLRL